MNRKQLAATCLKQPGATVELKPGGYHIMMTGLKEPLKEGAMVKGTLTFENAGTVPVAFKVEALAAEEPTGAHDHHDMEHMSK